jgi:hypothetical protein
LIDRGATILSRARLSSVSNPERAFLQRIRLIPLNLDPVKIPLGGDIGRRCPKGAAFFAVNHEQLGLLRLGDEASEITLRHVVVASGCHVARTYREQLSLSRRWPRVIAASR